MKSNRISCLCYHNHLTFTVIQERESLPECTQESRQALIGNILRFLVVETLFWWPVSIYWKFNNSLQDSLVFSIQCIHTNASTLPRKFYTKKTMWFLPPTFSGVYPLSTLNSGTQKIALNTPDVLSAVLPRGFSSQRLICWRCSS